LLSLVETCRWSWFPVGTSVITPSDATRGAVRVPAFARSRRRHPVAAAVGTSGAGLGLRVGEAISLDVSDQSYNRGHRAIRYIGKGSFPRGRVLPAHALEALDEYLTIRAALTGADVDAHRTNVRDHLHHRRPGPLGVAGAARSPRRLARNGAGDRSGCVGGAGDRVGRARPRGDLTPSYRLKIVQPVGKERTRNSCRAV
jgi:integrase